jgi:hypothetical protein
MDGTIFHASWPKSRFCLLDKIGKKPVGIGQPLQARVNLIPDKARIEVTRHQLPTAHQKRRHGRGYAHLDGLELD